MRYRGQAYNLTVPFAGRPVTAETIAEAVARFEDEHRRLYDYTPEVTETEIVTLRVRAQGRIASIDWNAPEAATAPNGAAAGREVYAGGGARRWALVHRARAARPTRRSRRRRSSSRRTPRSSSRRAGAAGSTPAATLVLEREEA